MSDATSDPRVGRPPVALTIAGSDSSGGAGIAADLKTFHRFGVFGACTVTLVTAQSTEGVEAITVLRPDLVVRQIELVAGDLGVDAAKTGALGSAEIVEAVADAVARAAITPLVVDPVMISKHGAALLDEAGVGALRDRLLPHAALVTPNLPEAEALTGRRITTETDAREAARVLRDLGAAAVLLKGGHAAGPEAVDWLDTGTRWVRLAAPRIETRHTHGTGCTLSAAITARLALGDELERAVRIAKAFVTRAIERAPGLGHGQGPLDHWA